MARSGLRCFQALHAWVQAAGTQCTGIPALSWPTHSLHPGQPPAVRCLHTPTSLPPGGYTPVTKQLWLQRQPGASSKAADAACAATSKPPHKCTVVYPFVAEHAWRLLYQNPWGTIRVGRVLEDLDSMAGFIAWDHVRTSAPGLHSSPTLVTAAVDAIGLRHPLDLDHNITMTGQVVWTGTSSIDIQMQLFQDQHGGEASLEALFSFVARDPATNKATRVVQVQPDTVEGAALFAQRQAVADERRAARAASPAAPKPLGFGWAGPLLEEARLAAELPALAAPDAVLMPVTAMQNTFMCQPQQVNMHGRIFGGFLMRRAFELGFATTYMFAGAKPSFVNVDQITFTKPVDVGDLLRLRSCVLHASHGSPLSDKGLVHVEVEARVTKPERVTSHVTNTFHFTFAVAPQPGRRLRRVLPTCEDEALRARRWH